MRVSSPGIRTAALAACVLAAGGLFAAAFSAETPMGSLHGRLVAADTERPLPRVKITISPLTPNTGKDAEQVVTDGAGEFEVERLPEGDYRVEPSTRAYVDTPLIATVREGETAEASFSLQPGAPYLHLNVHERAYLPGESPRIALNGFRQGSAVQLKLFRISADDLLRKGTERLQSLLSPLDVFGSAGAAPPELGDYRVHLVRTWSHRVTRLDAEGVFYEHERLGSTPAGLYVLEANGSASAAYGWLAVTDLALVTKSAAGRVLAFTLDLDTGQPVAGAEVRCYDKSKLVSRGTTDAHGRWETQPGVPPNQQCSVVARRGDSVALMSISTYGDRYFPDGRPERYRVFTYTDRPVYRPGHQVFFKGIVRRLEEAGYSIPSPRVIRVKVTDPEDTSLYESDLELNDRGSFAGGFRLPAEERGGSYTITISIEGEKHTSDFAVASYRKPEWKVDVSVPKARYVRGERVPVSVHAEYYYGAPVASAKVQYMILRSAGLSFWNEDEGSGPDAGQAADEGEEDAGDESSGGGEVVTSGNLTTDANGSAQFEFPTASTPGEPEPELYGSNEFEYTVQVSVRDLSDREVSGTAAVQVGAGEFSLRTVGDRSVIRPGETAAISARAEDADHKPVSGLPVTATASLDTWNGRGLTHQVLSRQERSTDAAGRVSFPFRLDQGFVTIRLTARDRRGNQVTGTADVWVTTYEGGDYSQKYPDLSIVPDRKSYRIGDTAQFLINTDKPGATAIVALEAERVLDLVTVRLKTRSTVLRFPIRAGYEPDVFVSACFVQHREFFTTRVAIHVNPSRHRIQVTIDSDRPGYHPGDEATFRVHTRDENGKPLSADVSLGVVDEAVYAIRKDDAGALWRAFYPRRQDDVVTQFSYPTVYLGDADKDAPDVSIRKKFPDTAYWNPFLKTGPTGEATVHFPMPDTLTSWRATAQAVTADTRVGRATFNVTVAKELTLRLETPRSLTEGDTLAIAAIVHNYTRAPQDVVVRMEARGAELDGGQQQRHLNPNDAARLTWQVRAKQPGEATFTATAQAGSFSDGMELKVPIRAFARETVVYRTGAASGGTSAESLDLDADAVRANLELRLSPTLAGAMLGSLDYLATYPYGCTEQTMSSFLPDVVLLRTMHGLALHKPNLENRLPAMTQAGLLRLYHYQHQDGGWGWWEYDETSPWMTAYVLFGLTVAKDAGVPLNEKVYANARGAAKKLAISKTLDPDDATFLAYAMARAGLKSEAHDLLQRFRKDTGKLELRSAGYRVLALLATGDSADRDDARAGMEYLWSVADGSGGVFHWEERRNQYYWEWPADAETTAVALKAGLALDPSDPRLAGVVRWLLLKRRGNQWVSTRDTAWILFALADYLKATGELHPDYRVTVLLNGTPIATERVTAAEALSDEKVVRVPLTELQPHNRVEIRTEGEGTAYYALRLDEEVHAAGFTPESTVPGLTIQREYFRMESHNDRFGRPVSLPERRPSQRLTVGEGVLVRLTLYASHPQEFLLIEDPLPAGCEVQDRGDVTPEDWQEWYSRMEVRDDRVNFFVRRLGPGKHTIQYYMRPEQEGSVRALPVVLSDMYEPAVRAATGEGRLEIGR